MLQPAAPRTQPPMTAAEVPLFIARMREQMHALRLVLEAETTFVSNHRLRESAELQVKKTEMSLRYMADFDRLKANIGLLRVTAPKELDILKFEHDVLQTVLSHNLTALATAQAVAESIIRGVANELEAKTRPSTYGANGRTHNSYGSRTAAPLAVSRSL